MLRRRSRNRVNSTPLRLNLPDDFQAVKRPLRSATPFDRVCIFIGVFVAGALVTGFLYWQLSLRLYWHSGTERLLFSYSGVAARWHFLAVMAGGGVAGMLLYLVISYVDPYGNRRADEQREQERILRAQLRENLGFRDPREYVPTLDDTDDDQKPGSDHRFDAAKRD